MAWYDEAVFYHIYPLGLTGAPKQNDYSEPVHRLNTLLPWIGHHEPCEACYVSGTNLITAETGVNPRDTAEDTSTNRGMDLTDCRRMLYEAGFTKLAKGDGTLIDLDMDYIQAHIH